jgi:hypothetical protein
MPPMVTNLVPGVTCGKPAARQEAVDHVLEQDARLGDQLAVRRIERQQAVELQHFDRVGRTLGAVAVTSPISARDELAFADERAQLAFRPRPAHDAVLPRKAPPARESSCLPPPVAPGPVNTYRRSS